jgi:transcriptional regulator with XRE-family HTH domain
MPQFDSVRINGPALRELRVRRGLEVRQLAGKIGRHPQSVRHLEVRYGANAGRVFAYQLANALEVDISAFVLGDDDEPEAAKPESEAEAA